MTTDVLLEPMSSTGDLTATVKSCLTQVRCDVRKVVECSPDEELVHRLRIGLRHLRTVLREVRADKFGADVAWEKVLRSAYRELGRHRDRAIVLPAVRAELYAAGCPAIDSLPPSRPVRSPQDVVRTPRFQHVLRGIRAFAHRMDDTGGAKGSVDKPAREFLAKRLHKLHRLLARDADRFSRIGSARQHRVRKRLERLLCLSAFATTLFIPGSVTRYVAKWRDAETDLGRANDLRSATPLLKIRPSDTPGERFAARWLGRRRRTSARRCQKELCRVIQKTVFWGSGVPVPGT